VRHGADDGGAGGGTGSERRRNSGEGQPRLGDPTSAVLSKGRRLETAALTLALSMDCDLAAAVLEFPSRAARAGIVAPYFGSLPAIGRPSLSCHPTLLREVTINCSHACDHPGSQLLPPFGIDRLLVGAELRIRMVLMSQSEDRDEPAAVLFVIDEIEPVLAS